MKPIAAIISCSAAAAIAVAGWAQVQQPERRPAQQPGQRQVERPADVRPLHERIGQPAPMLHHIADIHNKRVENMLGENLGNIDTLIADVHGGQVTYAIVSVGGFLGIADTLVAVPWKAFQLRPMFDGLVLDMTRSELEAAPSFDRQRWPDFRDPQWNQEVHQYYGTTPGMKPDMRDRDQRPGQPQPRQPGQVDRPTAAPGELFARTKQLIGTRVENRAGENLGNLDNIAMDIESGEISFGVIGVGGFLGLWQTHVTAPWQAMEITHVADRDYRIVLDATREQLDRAPEYDMDKWPTHRDVEWARDTFPGVRQAPMRDPMRDRDPQPRDD